MAELKSEVRNEVGGADCGVGDVVERDVVDCEFADSKDCESMVRTASCSPTAPGEVV